MKFEISPLGVLALGLWLESIGKGEPMTIKRSFGEAIYANHLRLPVSHDDLTGCFVALYLLGEDHNLVGERVWWVAMAEAGILR